MVELNNEPLAKHCTFKIGGEARVIFPETKEEFSSLIRTLKTNDELFRIFGNGSNVLFPDEGTKFSAIFTTQLSNISVSERAITADCGATLNSLASTARDEGLTGLEFAYGIPGTVGGGLFMNAGAFGGQLSDVVTSCRAVNKNGEIVHLSKAEMCLGYRESIFRDAELFVLDATFELCEGDKREISKVMANYMERRKKSQPLEFPSAGSVFKRPPGNFAGSLIEKAGLKGLSVGDAQVSQKHAGFIINRGDASAKDVKELISLIRKRVKEYSGVLLEPEVMIFSETDLHSD